MKCRKCGCEILETDERCPMCDARQRGVNKKSKKRYPSDSEKVKNGDSISKRGIIVLVVLLCVVVSFVIFRSDLLGVREFSIPEMALFLNRIDGHTTGNHQIQMTEDRVYIAGRHGNVIVFDHNMTHVETINIDGEVMVYDNERNHVSTYRLGRYLSANTLYIADESIYFIDSFLGLLRYDLNTEIVEQIGEISDFQYVLGVGTGGQWYYFTDPYNEDRFFYIDDIYGARNLYGVNILEEEHNLIASDVETLAIIPDYLIIASRQGIYIYHEESSERSYLDFDFSRFGIDNSITTGGIFVKDDDLFILDGWDNILYHKTLSGGYVREIINDIWWFAVVGNYIIYQTTDWEDLNIYVMDLEGNNMRILISYERKWSEDEEYWFPIRTAP